MSQPILRWEGDTKQGCVFQKRKTHGSRHQCLFEENVRKTKKGSADFKEKGSGVVYARGRCAKSRLQYLFIFPFYIFYVFSLFMLIIFWGRQERCPCSYISSSAMRNSDLHCSLKSKNVMR